MAFRLAFSRHHSYAGKEDAIWLPVFLRSSWGEIELIASLDTGASHCLFQRKYADAPGLSVEDSERTIFTTAAGRFAAYGHDVTIDALGVETHATVFFFEDDTIYKNVLGRRGWLDRVIIAIADHDQTLYLSPHGESAVA